MHTGRVCFFFGFWFLDLVQNSAGSVRPLQISSSIFFDSGNLAKVNRMSTAHMQGEHLIKGTHTLGEKSGKVLRGSRRSCCQKHVRYVT